MKEIKLEIKGLDQFGNERTETVKVIKYNWLERAYRWIKYKMPWNKIPRIVEINLTNNK